MFVSSELDLDVQSSKNLAIMKYFLFQLLRNS